MSQESNDRSFRQLEALSFVHSGIYFALLACWIFEGPALLRNRLGWAHGLIWIGMTILVILAARKAIVSFRLAVLVAVIGGLGPFAGTAGFIYEGRQRRRERSVANPTSNDAPS